MGTFIKKQIKKRAIKLPIAVLVCAMLVIGGGLAYKAMALSGINITAPTVGVNWSGTKEITWGGGCVDISNVNIYYSTDGFNSSTRIVKDISCSSGTYSWDTIGVADGDNYKIKVADSSDVAGVYDVSGVFTIDNTKPNINTNTLTSPNGGEFWAGGSSKNITWTASDITDTNLKANPINLYYTTDNGSTWNIIAEGLVNTSPYSWTVPNTNSATVKVKIIATDLAGNTASDESDAVFVIDSTKPTATVTTSVDPIKIGALAQTVVVTYNESMNTDTTPTITLTGSNWGTQVPGNWTTTTNTNDTYTTTLTHNGTAEEIANAVATVATASGATDLAGNSDIGDSSDVFVIDTKAPTVTTNGATANPDPAKAGTVTITVVFDENMDTTVFPTVQITGIIGSPITVPQSSYANKTWIGIFTLADNNEETTATISITGAKDAAGNVMADDTDAGTFIVDTVDPTVTSMSVGTLTIYDSDLIQEVTINYSEAMSVTAPTIIFSATTGKWTAGVGSWDTNKKVWTQPFTITDAGEETTGVDIAVSGVTDLAGNIQTARNLENAFNIDTKNPTVVLSDNHADNIVRDADIVMLTATFSEVMVSAPTITIDTTDTDLAATAMSGSDKVWTYSYDVPTGSDGIAIVIISGTDIAGNPNEAATGETRYTIDNTAPTIAVVLNDSDGYINAAETASGINITITTADVEDGQTVTCNVKDGGSAHTVGPLTGNITSNTVTIASGALTSLNDGTITATCNVSDVAGNPAVQGSGTSIKDVAAPIAPTVITYTSVGGTVVVNKVNTTNTNFTGGATITADQAVGGYAELLIGGVSFTTSIKDKSIVAEEVAIIFDAELLNNSAVQTQIAAGNQTLSVKLCDVAGNCTTSTDTKSITADYIIPIINSVALGNDEYVNAAETASGVDIIVNTTGVEDGQIATCKIKDSASTPNIVGPLTGTINSNTVTIASGALTSLNDGTITATCDVSDIAGNPAVQGLDASTKDIINPTGSATSPDYSTSLTFNVSYTASDTDGSGVQYVELYYTTNNGSTWTKYGETYSSSSISFTALADGTYGFYLVATDSAGNSEAAPVSGTTPDDSTIIDTGSPIATVGISTNPITDNSLSQTITVTYNEAMISVNPTITITGLNSSYNVTGGTWSKTTYNNDTYTVLQAITDNNEESTATVNVSGAKDLAGNDQVVNNSKTFAVDTENPTVISVTPATLADADTTGSVSVVITFSEAMGSTDPAVTITGLTTSYTVSVVSTPWSSDKKTWTGTFTFVDQNEVGTGTYNISGAKDAVGNEMAVDTSKQVIVDTKNPTATVTVGTPIISDSDLVQEVTVSYDEAMNPAISPVITLTGTNWGVQTSLGWTENDTIYTATFTHDGDPERIDEAVATVANASGATDLAGNAEVGDTSGTFIIDTQAPVKPDATKMTVAMNAPGTADTISGSNGAVEANSTVKVYSDLKLTSQINGSVTADENGSFGSIGIGDNAHAIVYVTATDTAGNESLATAMTNDIAAPSVPTNLVLTDPVNNGNKTTVAITGTGEADASINWTISDKNSSLVSGIGAVNNSGNINITGINVSGLADGILTLSLTLTDSAGNVSAIGTDTATKDTAIPTVVNVTSTKADSAYKAGVSIDITVEFNEAVTVTGAPQLELKTGTTDRQASYSSGSGTNILTFTYIVQAGDTSSDLDYTGTGALALNSGTIKDGVGNDAILTLSNPGANGSLGANKAIVIDTTAPSGYTVNIDQAYINSGNKTAMSFTFANAEEGATYTYSIDSSASVTGEITSSNQQITNIDVSGLNDGTLTLTVYLTDPAGNQGNNITDTVVKDTTAPILNEKTPVLTPTNDSTPDYTFSSTEAGAITYGGSCSSLTTNAVVGNNIITFNALADGTYSDCTITVTDAAGNSSTVAVSEFMVDTTPPVIVSLTPGNKNTTSDTTPAISADFSENGSGVNVSSIIFSFSGNEEYANEYAVKSAMGVVYNQITPLVAKTYKATVTVVDNAGNSATKTWSFIVNPTATTIAVSSDKYSAYADGVSEIKITAEIRDEMGNPITSGAVNFVASPIGDLSDITSSLDENGFATAILTSDEIGNSTVTAYYDASSGPINSSAYVYFAETPKTISVTADPVNVSADGSAESTIATVLDNGAALQGATVNFTTDLGTLSSPTATTDANGQATVTLTSTNVGWANIEVSYDTGNGTIYSWTYVEFTEYTAPDTTPPTAIQYPADGSTDVAVDVNPTITFSEAMDESTISNTSIELRKYDGTSIGKTLNTSTVNGITTVTIIPNSDLDYSTETSSAQYYFWVSSTVKDLAGISFGSDWQTNGKDNHEFTTAVDNSICFENDDGTQTCNISLNAGWNLISLPLIPKDSDIAVVLAGIINDVEIVWYYKNGDWAFYIPIGTGNTLATMEDGKGYWIFMKNADTLTVNGSETIEGGGSPLSYPLVEDNWNLIGFKSTEKMKAGDYVRDFTDKTLNENDILWNYKNGSYPSAPLHSSDDMEPGYGYWLLMK